MVQVTLLIHIQFWMWMRVGPRNHVLDGVQLRVTLYFTNETSPL